MRLLRGLSFHWGWFLRYKLSQPQHRHPSWARHPLPLLPRSTDIAPAISLASTALRHAVRPQTPARHTAYPLSPTDSGGSGRLSVCYGVSRASYIFSGCITLLPRSPFAPLPLPLPPRSRPPLEPHRSSIASTSPRSRVTLDVDETFPVR